MIGQTTRWGVLGTGFIAGLVMEGAKQAIGVRVEAVGSRDQARADAFARHHDIPRAYGGYASVLADPDLDVVYIGVPNSLHVDLAIAALEAGKHVLCEKPFTSRTSEATRAFDVADRTGRMLSEAFMWRHLPGTRHARDLVGSGAIGELRRVRSRFSFVVTDPGDVRLSAELDGGSLMDIGCYCVSGARLFAGEPVAVRGERDPAPSGVDMRFRGSMRFASGVTAEFESALDLPFEARLELVGSAGTLRVLDPWHGRLPGLEVERNGRVEALEVPVADPYGLELEDFSAAIQTGRRPLLGREDAVGQARAIESLRRAARTGEPVDLAA